MTRAVDPGRRVHRPRCPRCGTTWPDSWYTRGGTCARCQAADVIREGAWQTWIAARIAGTDPGPPPPELPYQVAALSPEDQRAWAVRQVADHARRRELRLTADREAARPEEELAAARARPAGLRLRAWLWGDQP